MKPKNFDKPNIEKQNGPSVFKVESINKGFSIEPFALPMQFEQQVLVRFVKQSDIPGIKQIADQNRNALGFLPRAKLDEVTKSHRAFVIHRGELIIGFVIFRHRSKDFQTTLSDICIRNEFRGQGYGKTLMKSLISDCLLHSREYIQLKCPIDLTANMFYKNLGFTLAMMESGKKRPLNVWRLYITNDLLGD